METAINEHPTTSKQAQVISKEQLLENWQGHRRVTRRMIEAFPEDKLFTYSIGGMRTFAQLVLEVAGMAGPGVVGAATGKWPAWSEASPEAPTKQALLKLWDETTAQIDAYWPQISIERFQEVDKAFGAWEGTVQWILFYFIDNEIHHRGQAYVYLRSLGIEPPAFWDRS